MMNTTQAQDTSAKLLATENITVLREPVKTASFDLKNRVLRLPRWKNMTPAIEEMLVLHEVGHALFTITDEYVPTLEKEMHLAGYVNVIEDARIERMMKVRYPGSRKSFGAGYKALIERDFFQLAGRKLEDLLLIDRINLYYKAGFNCGVKFTPEEMKFVRRADTTVTVDDVINLAREIYTFSKEAREEQKKKQQQQMEKMDDIFSDEEDVADYDYESLEDEDDEWEDSASSQKGDAEGDEDEEDESDEDEFSSSGKGSGTGELEGDDESEAEDSEMESYTDKALNEQLTVLADTDLEIRYYKPEFYEVTPFYQTIVGYKEILELMRSNVMFKSTLEEDFVRQSFKNWKSASDRIVNYLVKEFEMRKSASAYKRSKQAKLGQLDPKKLFAFKLKEDLFKQVTRVQDGKRHGMVFLLDWSGSMRDGMTDTVEQVLNLAMFCQRIGIPYQVFAFTDVMSRHKLDANLPKARAKKVEGGLGDNSCFNLLELFSNKMSAVEFNLMVRSLRAHPWNYINSLHLGGTPLNEALMYLVDYMGKFISKNQTEKNTLVVLTDGEGGELGSNTLIYNGYRSYTGQGRVKSFLIDPMTKKEYPIESDSGQQTRVLMKVIKDRYGVNLVRYFVASNNSDVYRFMKHNIGKLYSSYDTTMFVRDMKKDGAKVITGVEGCDEMYLMFTKSKVLNDVEVKIDPSMRARAIAKQLTDSMSNVKSSRVILDKFIHLVS